MKKIFKQIFRGCGTLPYVGEHPGTMFLFFLIAMGALAGKDGGWWGCIGGASLMSAVFLPAYFYGAYSRAALSDQLRSKEDEARK